MLTQLQLEGPDLDTLLARVRSEVGESARIVKAEKVRSGGVAGFFAKQSFEITVEVDEASAAPDADERQRPPVLSLIDLADQVSDVEAAVSTESGAFSALLANLSSSVGSATGGGAATAHDSDGAAPVARSTRTAAATPAPTAGSVPAPVAPSRTAGSVPRVNPVQTAGPADGRVVRPAVFPTVERTAPPTLGRVDVSTREVPPGPADDKTTPVQVVPRPRPAEPAAGASRVVAAPRPAAVAARPAGGRAVPSGSASAAALQLSRLGLPAHLRPEPGAASLSRALVRSLQALPTAPRLRNRAGGVIAVVGPAPLALEVAKSLHKDLKLPAAAGVVLATGRTDVTALPERQVLRDVDDAAARRATWRRRRNVTIVAVDAPLTAMGAARARAYVSALDAGTTWGVVEATRKASDIGTWTKALGGVDALALSGVEDTADPATVLQLGIPVARMGNRRATPSAWAALLCSRLAG